MPRNSNRRDWSQEERLLDVGLGELDLYGLEIRCYQELGTTTSGQETETGREWTLMFLGAKMNKSHLIFK